MNRCEVDYLIVGGGFFGCCLALFLRSVSERVVVLEAGDRLMQRASLINQARIHTGFHYPRSVLTAFRSMLLSQQFAQDFPEAVQRDFRMLYAISARRSKVEAQRFYRFFREMGAPIHEASQTDAALFDTRMIEAVFECVEWAFDSQILAEVLEERLKAASLEVRYGTRAQQLQQLNERVVVQLSDGTEITAKQVFNVTYAEVNTLLRRSNLPEVDLKFELAELVMIDPPEVLDHVGITVMDGAYFSTMPYPPQGCYSLSHVRYTPQTRWHSNEHPVSPYEVLERTQRPSYAHQMIADSKRYLPCMEQSVVRGSVFEVKAIPTASKINDSRPILYHKGPCANRVTTVLGGKIDNVYDLFTAVKQDLPECASAHDRLLTGRQTV